MIDSLLADLVVGLHLAFVLFVVLGGLLALRWPRVAWLHLPATSGCSGGALTAGVPQRLAAEAIAIEAPGYRGASVATRASSTLRTRSASRARSMPSAVDCATNTACSAMRAICSRMR